MSESFPRPESTGYTSEYLRKRAFNHAVTELLYNSLTLARGEGSIYQPSREEGPLTVELYPELVEAESVWHSIGIIVHEAGDHDPFLGEHQLTIQLCQQIIEPETEKVPPVLEFIKQYDVFYKNQGFIVHKHNVLMDYVDLAAHDFKNREQADSEEIVGLNKLISSASQKPPDF